MRQGSDCHNIDVQQILDVNGIKYTFTDPFDPNATIEVDVTSNGNELTVVQPFGNGKVTLKFSKSNAYISSFTPECEENRTSAKKRFCIFKKLGRVEYSSRPLFKSIQL